MFALKLEWRDGHQHTAVRWEEFETRKDAEARAKATREMGAKVTIYEAL